MTREELTDRICELFPPLAEVKPWEWAETEEDEPVVMVENHATFTGLDGGVVDLTTPIPNTAKIGVYRIEPDATSRCWRRGTTRSQRQRLNRVPATK